MMTTNLKQEKRPAENPSGVRAKWGDAVTDSGWTTVPNTLLKNAYRLKLDPTETLTLIYLLRFWWHVDDMPYPSISKTSIEMGVTRKTMAKKFASLQDKGLIKLVKQKGRRKFSLAGLREQLEYLEQNPESIAEEDGDDYDELTLLGASVEKTKQ